MISSTPSSTMLRMYLVIAGLLGTCIDMQACATCFGATDSPLGKGLNWGILALLIVVNCVIGGICAFFVFIAKRAAQVRAEEAAVVASGAAGPLAGSKSA